ncbi:MAG: restriction endonuclease [Haliea sp.]|uniref:EcoRII N-terminal effector-binding domain-containing protein n=1 Tax=Haliea sp. TaxID=1932666 RepID=UPI000C5996BF|nr:EcoRII N-terminal effector-binding domain-containing protein [Haliea sp.]MBM69474.1 restriction endonuclease [Haliea sp.]|tara:strand:- start:6305 stop:6733 length:429 start_codon:yes stop_codon:yes gene_type:complete
MSKSYKKVLTKNDTGETGGHQAGIAVPKKDEDLLSFFPRLDPDLFNPDAWITCIDPDGDEWELRYIYYNGKTFDPPKSTRNEYRLTHLTKFFSKWSAESGDSLVFTSTERETYFKLHLESVDNHESINDPAPIVLAGWKPVF